jgi:NHLM bacteriocin system ABC transporter peptidase/ATP-binding protein
MKAGAGRRARTPTVLQMEAVECGAAALAMVLAHHGRHVPLEELRAACGVSRDGSKASNLARAARRYGLTARGYRKEPGELRGLPVPMIVHWNFNHFVVLEGFRGQRAYLNDPAAGATVVSEAEFDQSFTGVALVLEPSPDFERGGEPPGLLKPLLRRLRGSAPAVAYVVLAGLGLVVTGLVAPSFSRVFVDEVLVKGLHRWGGPLLMLMGLTAVLAFVLTLAQQRYLLRLESRLALETSSRFFWHVLRLPIEFFTQRFAGDIAGRVSANDRVARLLSGDLATTSLSLLVIALYAVLMFRYDALLAAVGVATALLNLGALRYVSHTRVSLSQRLLQGRGKLMGTAMGGLQTIETLKATGSESDFFARWSGYQAKVANADQELRLTTLVLQSVPPFLLAANGALVLGLGGLRVIDGHLSMGMLVALSALMAAFLAPVNRMVDLGGTLQDVKADMNRLDDVLKAKAQVDADAAEPLPGPPPPRLSGALELRGVTFGYSPLEPPLIAGIDLRLRPGSRVALVGGSGSGKSTIAKLVAGLYEPWGGEILFDGRPRAEVPRAVLTSSLAVVDQEVCLFGGAVKDNLALWDETLPEADLVQAAKDAAIHEEIAARPGGYASTVEEGGRNFSGGQRQRMEIARALAGDPRILVLDEATSALDPATEKAIDDAVRRRGCTCVIVAHRLSTIRDCDEIVVLDAGRVAQRGSHEALFAVPGPYRDLVASE